jgi:hypothetical protein
MDSAPFVGIYVASGIQILPAERGHPNARVLFAIDFVAFTAIRGWACFDRIERGIPQGKPANISS